MSDRQVLTDLIERIPKQTYLTCTGRNFARAWHMPKSYVLGGTPDHVMFNDDHFLNVLAVDLDRQDSVLACCDIAHRQVQPNVVVENPANGHAHALYFLGEPAQKSAPVIGHLIRDMEQRLAILLQADPHYSSTQWQKSPLSPNWRTHLLHDQPCRLGVMGAFLPPKPTLTYQDLIAPQRIWERGTRNASLFRDLGDWMRGQYRLRPQMSPDEWYQMSLNKAMLLYQQMPDQTDFHLSEVAATARSVAEWVGWDTYQPRRYSETWNFGRDQLKGKGFSLKEAQSFAAYQTHAARRQRTAQVIAKAQSEYPSAPHSQLALLTGLDVRTVRSYLGSESDHEATIHLNSILLSHPEPAPHDETRRILATAKRDHPDASERELAQLTGLSRNTIARYRHVVMPEASQVSPPMKKPAQPQATMRSEPWDYDPVDVQAMLGRIRDHALKIMTPRR